VNGVRQVSTANGFTVEADNVVLATNSPIHHNLAVHSRQEPYRSYVVGLRIPEACSQLHVTCASVVVNCQSCAAYAHACRVSHVSQDLVLWADELLKAILKNPPGLVQGNI
jgi:hypothetical protein